MSLRRRYLDRPSRDNPDDLTVGEEWHLRWRLWKMRWFPYRTVTMDFTAVAAWLDADDDDAPMPRNLWSEQQWNWRGRKFLRRDISEKAG